MLRLLERHGRRDMSLPWGVGGGGGLSEWGGHVFFFFFFFGGGGGAVFTEAPVDMDFLFLFVGGWLAREAHKRCDTLRSPPKESQTVFKGNQPHKMARQIEGTAQEDTPNGGVLFWSWYPFSLDLNRTPQRKAQCFLVFACAWALPSLRGRWELWFERRDGRTRSKR